MTIVLTYAVEDGTQQQLKFEDDVDDIRIINIRGMVSIDLTPLATCSSLKALSLYANKLQSVDLTPLASCTNLQYLSLSEHPYRTIDLSPLASCTSLQYVHLLENQFETIDLSPLSACTTLKELNMWGNQFHSVTLAACRSLEELDLHGNKLQTIDLSPLSACTSLQELDLLDNKLQSIDLSPLGNCTSLRMLNLWENQLQTIDLSPLANCARLETLCLRQNKLKYVDLSPLGSCASLQQLFLDSNQLQTIDLRPLSSCTNLMQLTLSRNELQSIDRSPLDSCTNLESLAIDGQRRPGSISQQRRPELFRHIIDPEIALEEARTLLQKGDIKHAEETIMMFLTEDFRNFEREQAAGKRSVVFEYHPHLWKLLAEITKKKGNKSSHDQAKKMVQVCEKRLEEIAKMVREERKVYKSDRMSWSESARALHSSGLVAEALQYSKEAYHLEPNNREVSRIFLIALSNARFYGMAEEVAKKSIKSGMQDSIFKEMLAVSLVFQRKYEEAIPALDEVIRIQPNNGGIWQLLSLSYGNLGRNREAAEALRRMIDLKYEEVYARRILSEIESIGVDIGTVPGFSFRVATAAAVEKSGDDSVVTQDELFILGQLLKEGATSESCGMGLMGGDSSSWDVAVILNLVAKGFAVFTQNKIAYLTQKGVKKIQEMSGKG